MSEEPRDPSPYGAPGEPPLRNPFRPPPGGTGDIREKGWIPFALARVLVVPHVSRRRRLLRAPDADLARPAGRRHGSRSSGRGLDAPEEAVDFGLRAKPDEVVRGEALRVDLPASAEAPKRERISESRLPNAFRSDSRFPSQSSSPERARRIVRRSRRGSHTRIGRSSHTTTSALPSANWPIQLWYEPSITQLSVSTTSATRARNSSRSGSCQPGFQKMAGGGDDHDLPHRRRAAIGVSDPGSMR